MKKKSSLQVKAILLISVIFIVLVGTVTYEEYSSSKSIILSSLENSGKQTVTIHAQNLSSWVEARLSQVEVIANTELVSGMDASKILPYFAREQKNYGGAFNSFGISDSKGNLTLQSKTVVNIGTESTFPQVMSGQSVISDPFSAKEDPSSLIISMECPVRNVASGKVVGLVSGACLVDTVFKQNTNFHLGKTDQVYILNKSGSVLYHPDSKKENTDLLKSSNAEFAELVGKSLASENSMGRFTDGGAEKMLFSARVDGTDWTMFLEVPTEEYTASITSLLSRIVAVSAGATAVLILLLVVLLRVFFRRLSRLSTVAGQVSAGNLTCSLPESTDELGRINAAFNRMTDNLKTIIVKIRGVSNVIEESSGNCKKVSNQLLEQRSGIRRSISGVTRAAKDTNEEIRNITASMDDLEQQSRKLADISTGIDAMIARTSDQTSGGAKAMGTAVQTLGQMKESIRYSSGIITELSKRSETIADITTTIAAISRQTNLLALNASIEAARAGENGRGFSVVAGEVRNLAGQSAGASKKISQEIDGIRRQIAEAAESMGSSTAFVQNGTDSINRMLDIFGQIETEMKKIKAMSTDISEISRALLKKNEGIHDSVASTSAVSEGSLKSAMNFNSLIQSEEQVILELKDAAGHLDELSESLSGEVAKFATD